MNTRNSVCLCTFAALVALSACSTPGATSQVQGMDAQRTASNCVEGSAITGRVRFETCLVAEPRLDYAPVTDMHRPQMVTVVRTPVGAVANPTRWTVEVRRDGRLVVRREIDGLLQDAREGDEYVEVHDTAPLGDLEEIEPGTYEITYFSEDDEEPTSKATIEVTDEDEKE